MKLTAKPTRVELLARIEDLQKRLQEADETLRAIRRGEVDAVVVAGEEGEQVFTLRGADRPYRLLLEQMNEGAAILSYEGSILFCNARFADMVQTPLDKTIGSTLVHFVLPADRARVESFLSRPARIKVEARLRTRSGADVPVQLSVNLMKPDGAVVLGIVITDLTEQKRAEESLKRSNAYNRSLFEASLDPLAAAGLDGKITDVNAAAEAITGVAREKLIGDDYIKYFVEQETARAAFQQALREGAARDVLLHLRGRNGSAVPLVGSVVLLQDEAGRPAGILAGGRDISKLVAAEQRLRESEERYRAVVAASSQIIWLTNAQGEIVEDHPSWREFTGCTFEEGKGFGWANALHPDDRMSVLVAWRSAVASGAPFRTEYRFRRQDGEYRLFDVHAVPVRRTDGTVREWIGTCTDITDRRRHESERERLFESIRKIVAQLAPISGDLLAASGRHAEYARKQAAAASEAASTTAGVSRAAAEAAADAKRVGEAVSRTAEIGRAGRKAVADAVDAMGAVCDKTQINSDNIAAMVEPAQAIAEIIDSVNNFADQTHVLAINAALEAARAGEHGQGFAVVSEEIRSLAGRSKQATREITRILGEILDKANSAAASMEDAMQSVSNAVDVCTRAGETISALSETLVGVSGAAAQIVARSEQQADATTQIRQATEQIDDIATRHSRAAEKLQAAAQALSSLATELAGLAGKK